MHRTFLHTPFLIWISLTHFSSILFASSNIFDGTIVRIQQQEQKRTVKNDDGTKTRETYTRILLHFRASNSPYTSIGGHSRILNHIQEDGSIRPGGVIVRPLDGFESFFIDDIPVSQQDILPLLVEGARITTQENRGWYYYLRVRSRSAGNELGFLTETKTENNRQMVAIRRPQTKYRTLYSAGEDSIRKGARHVNGIIHLHPGFYVPLTTWVPLDADAVIVANGETHAWAHADLDRMVQPMEDFDYRKIELPNVTGVDRVPGNEMLAPYRAEIAAESAKVYDHLTAVVMQPARKRMRVEIIPEGYGDWESVTGRQFTRWDKQMQGMFSGLLLSEGSLETRELLLQKYSERDKKNSAPAAAPAFATFLLAGGRPQDGEEPGSTIYRALHNQAARPVYMVDGMFSPPGDTDWKGIVPGRLIVAHMRRSRPFADFIHLESESPSAWGTVTAIHGSVGEKTRLDVSAPDVPGIPVSGQQKVEIDEDAEYVYLGQPIEQHRLHEFLKKGALIRIYPKRPQTFLLNDGTN